MKALIQSAYYAARPWVELVLSVLLVGLLGFGCWLFMAWWFSIRILLGLK